MSTPSTADTTSCLNCGEQLSGSYCAVCGQESKKVRRPFIILIQGMLFTLFELDGRAYKSVFYLFTKPGFLSAEYFRGRRAAYTPPLRLFLVISIGFFLLVSLNNNLSTLRASLEPPGIESITSLEEELSAAGIDDTLTATILADLTQNPEELDADTILEIAGLTDEQEEALEDILEDEGIEAGFTIDEIGDVFDFIDDFTFPFVSEETNNNLRIVMRSQAEANYEEISSDPAEFFFNSLEYITFFMLLMMPLLALIQKIVFILSKRYYIEHLVLTLHNHAFLLLAVFIALGTSRIGDASIPFVSATFSYLSIAVSIWLVVYLYLSLKNFVGWGYFVSFFLFFLTSVAYFFVLTIGLTVFMGMLFFLS